MLVQPDDENHFGFRFWLYNRSAPATGRRQAHLKPALQVLDNSSFLRLIFTAPACSPGWKILYPLRTISQLRRWPYCRLEADGTPDPTSLRLPACYVSVIKPQTNGSIFWSWCIVRNISDWMPMEILTLHSTRVPETDGEVNDLIVQPDGKIIIVGLFDYYNGVGTRWHCSRNADGIIDLTFLIPAPDPTLYDALPQASTRRSTKYWWQAASYYNGTQRIGIVRIFTGWRDDCYLMWDADTKYSALFDIVLQGWKDCM